MATEWETPPPSNLGDVKRQIATEPVNVTLTYSDKPYASLLIAMGHGQTVFVTSVTDAPDYRESAERLAAQLEVFELAMGHAARELREGAAPCE